jgi:starch phosphorylase
MWWSWHAEGRDLWQQIDPAAWELYHNPVDLLHSIDRTRWHEIDQIEAVHERYQAAVAEFDKYMKARETWFDHQGVKLPGPVAYLCTEFGVHDSLPFYSGGLGILAGDHVKSSADLGLPLVAVGLLYRRGYFRQEVGIDGDQQHIYPSVDMRSMPVRPVASNTGGQLKVSIEFPGRDVHAAVWKLDIGRVPLLLLDTDIPENDRADRPITHQLYVAGREMRFCQELVLGVGAVRALGALGVEPSAWHVNEGHAAMSILERAAVAVEAGNDLEATRKTIREHTLFTLHTPVPAGNEVFDATVARKYLGPWADRTGTDTGELLALASADGHDLGRFDLGALAIRHSAIVNGVSKRHGEVVSQDWRHLIGGEALSVTNGVHTPTWIGRDAAAILVRNLGRSWPTRLLEDPGLLEMGNQVPDHTIWRAHQARKEIFVRFARGRLVRQHARQGASPDELREIEEMLPMDRLTLGFARRFATYKRATLMFSDWDRLAGILKHPDHPVQVVFAGKAHPADQHGQAFIRQIVELSKSDDFRGYVHFIEDYDARIARFMIQGTDVWVNNPRPPMEASGTSGMKAAINGTLNLSVLDGWWIEGYNGQNGWAFGSPDANGDWGAADHQDATAFYQILSDEVAPLYYDRDDDGMPHGWIGRMRESAVSTIHHFSAHRMVADYALQAYFPLGKD